MNEELVNKYIEKQNKLIADYVGRILLMEVKEEKNLENIKSLSENLEKAQREIEVLKDNLRFYQDQSSLDEETFEPEKEGKASLENLQEYEDHMRGPEVE